MKYFYLLLLFGSSLAAQDLPRAHWELLDRVGVSITQPSVEPLATKGLAGLSANLQISRNFPLSPRLFVGAGLGFSLPSLRQKSSLLDVQGLAVRDIRSSVRAMYFELPLQAKLFLGRKHNFFVRTGGRAMLLSLENGSAKAGPRYRQIDGRSEVVRISDYDLYPFNIALDAGIGFRRKSYANADTYLELSFSQTLQDAIQGRRRPDNNTALIDDARFMTVAIAVGVLW